MQQAEEFIRRFLLHVLPDGFRRIRYYYGFPGNRYREGKLAHCRELLGMPTPNHQPWKSPRTIVKPMKNSPARRCGSAQSVAKAACCCRDVHPGRCRLRLAHDEEDCREIQSKIFRPSLVLGGRLTAPLVPHPGCLEELFSVPKSGWFEALNSAFSLLAQTIMAT